MKRIESFIESIVKGVSLDSKEQEELREEMLGHLMENVDELMLSGYSKDEAIEKAIASFGDGQVIQSEMRKVLFPYYKFVRYGICTFVVAILICCVSHFVTQYYFPRHDPAITVDAFVLLLMICLVVLGGLEVIVDVLAQSKRWWLNAWAILFLPALIVQFYLLWEPLTNPNTSPFWIYDDYIFFPLYIIFYIAVRGIFTLLFVRKSLKAKTRFV